MAWPAFRSENPYNVRLYGELAGQGIAVSDFSPRKLLLKPPAVFHVHWPEITINQPSAPRALLRGVAFLCLLGLARLRGCTVVWTVHNLQSHERLHPALERAFWTLFLRLVSGFITLTEGGRRAALSRYPVLRGRPGFVVPSGHFRGICPDTVTDSEARAALGLPGGALVCGFLGQVRPYKNVTHLVRSFRSMADERTHLVVAGRPDTAATAADIVRAAGDDPRIVLALEHIADERVQLYLRSCDLVVLPFSDVLNSGSALLALAFDRPVLVPLLGSMGELQALAGSDWVRTYTGELTPGELATALRWARVTRRTRCDELEALDWRLIARRTLDAYRALGFRQAA